MTLTSIHPFPARMAPEVVRRSLDSIPERGNVFDPMCGSGTVVRIAVEAGLNCVGIDIDPLAVLMARVWTTRMDTQRICADAEDLVRAAKALTTSAVVRTCDPETKQFIDYWFADRQEADLARLATVLRQQCGPTKDVLSVVFSRIIVSKQMMASLAQDTSHSRPHRVARSNDFNVYAGFLRSARQVAKRLKPNLIHGQADIRWADARTLEDIEDDTFDLALTSPPYLNAIDYLRGHRLALVWLGYELETLREIRSTSVGAERILPKTKTLDDISPFVIKQDGSTINERHRGWIRRYAYDMDAVLRQLERVVKRNGQVVLVLGNSFLRGAKIDNSGLIESLATCIGLQIKDRRSRELPARRRYLPPPGSSQSALDTRMRTETVLTFTVN